MYVTQPPTWKKKKNSTSNSYRDKGETEIPCCRKICAGHCNSVERGVTGSAHL
ncbi:TPA: hypothetical protein PXR60_004231 [Yersinia enterocolitica]|nr:hypothetical protein [Yersinia enterocolitica]HDL8492400.1 hypothetical protein [Yersinia enterocolitica]HDQ4768893.1 hypothetical protein [Yersinia enterocolitica]